MLREIIESDAFAQSPSSLTLALGKDSAGNPVVGDLARMPHLLIAGATGTRQVGVAQRHDHEHPATRRRRATCASS